MSCFDARKRYTPQAIFSRRWALAPGWAVLVFTGNPRLAPAEEVPLFNGKIPCRLLRFGAEGPS
jgi:hypothetical protein